MCFFCWFSLHTLLLDRQAEAMIETMCAAVSSPMKRKAVSTPNTLPGKQRVLDAAERLFAANGFVGVSAAEIAREAGVAHGLLFHHFGSMEELYIEVSRVAVGRMDDVQLAAFKGKTPRDQIASFLRVHMRSIKDREGDAIFRARTFGAGVTNRIMQIWDDSRQLAIDRILELIGLDTQNKKMRLCLRAWVGFHDQLVHGWIAEKSVSEAEVLNWTMAQLDYLADTILRVDLNTPI